MAGAKASAGRNWLATSKTPNRALPPPRSTLLFGTLVIIGAELATTGALGPIINNPLTISLPYFALRTLGRMTIAYALSLAFALAYGISAAMNHRASHVMLPLLDILQSVPVLAVLPVVFVFFLNRYPGFVGEEMSSILLIFTAMVWAPTFGVIAGVNSIPQDIKEVSRAYGVRGFTYLRQIVLPAVYPELVWTSILAWGGGWYLITVEEYFFYGPKLYHLDGIGYYIADAASHSDLASSIFGVLVLVSIIIVMDKLIWRPLENRADKYKYESITSTQTLAHRESRVAGGFRKAEGRLVTPIISFFKYERAYLTSFLDYVHLRPRLRFSDRMRLHERLAKHVLWGKILSVAIFLSLFLIGLLLLPNVSTSSIINGVAAIQSSIGFPTLAYYTGRSLLRILTAYLIALAWTLGAGILIARSDRASRLLVPLFDIGQSIPATALFPIIVLLLVRPFPGNTMALEVASVLLMLTGMQWYILFNIVGAIHNIPTDILEASSAYRVRGSRFAREILIPASFPAVIIGSIQAWGGGWNATIVSEFIQGSDASTTYHVDGLGFLLHSATTLNPAEGALIIGAAILIMTATILVINRIVWRRLLKRADKYKFEV